MDSVNNGGAKGTDFQPSTQNPQTNVAGNLQPTGMGLQTASGYTPNAYSTIVVPNVLSATTASTQTTTPAIKPTYSGWLLWLGLGIGIFALAFLTIRLIKHRKYS